MSDGSEKVENEEMEEFEVVELESDDGEIEEFVVLDRIQVQDCEYAIMALMEDMENMDGMTEEEFREFYGDDDIFFIMKQDGEDFLELSEEEFALIKDDLDREMAARGL